MWFGQRVDGRWGEVGEEERVVYGRGGQEGGVKAVHRLFFLPQRQPSRRREGEGGEVDGREEWGVGDDRLTLARHSAIWSVLHLTSGHTDRTLKAPI